VQKPHYDLRVDNLTSLMPVVDYRPRPFVKGRGSWVWDSDGQKHLDLCAGQFGATLGHSNRGLRRSIARSFGTISHLDTYSLSPSVISGFSSLQEAMPDFPFRGVTLSTGAEANEFALRYSKFIQGRDGVVSFDQGYLGQTLGTAGYSDSRSRVRPLVPLSFSIAATDPRKLESVEQQEDDSIAKLSELLAREKSIGTIVVEQIVSGAGVLVQSPSFLQRIREVADDAGAFLIFDECQTGAGRIGEVAYFQKVGVVPDFVVLGKGIGAGFPLSIVLASKASVNQENFEMKHFSSHQNEPVHGEVLSWVISRITQPGFKERLFSVSATLRRRLNDLVAEFEMLEGTRGEGLLLGLGLRTAADTKHQLARAKRLVSIAANHGLLLQTANFGSTVRLLPSLYLSEREIDFFYRKMRATVKIFEMEEPH
jgi:4-aminobutyrate aminotransferase-like enzyme